MNLDRFEKLLDAYGGSPERWPNEEREAAKELLETNEQARALRVRADGLDEALDSWQVKPLDAVRDRILGRLPLKHSLIDRFVDWLLPRPHRPAMLWRPVLIASLPLALGIILGGFVTLNATDNSETWQEEIYLMAVNVDDVEPQP